MAQRITELVCKKYKRRLDGTFESVKTEEIALVGGPFKNYKSVLNYQKKIAKQIEPFGFSTIDAAYLVQNYGKQTKGILSYFETLKTGKPDINLALAELDFCVKNEMTQNLLDFFIRRTGRLYFDIKSIDALKAPILNAFANYFNWDKDKVKSEKALLESALIKATHFE